jgi:hypothetical protein
VYEVIPVRYADWADALLTVVDEVPLEQKIPPEIRDALLSFLRDGALYGASLYDDSKKPEASSGGG